jgi:glycerol kinase
MMIGMTRGTTAAHVARAAVESMAYQSCDLAHAMTKDAGIPLSELRVDGGAAVNDDLMQFQSDMLGVTVCRPKIAETTALGAAYLAGLAVGFWQSQTQLKAQWSLDRQFRPQMPAAEREQRYAKWLRAVERARGWET